MKRREAGLILGKEAAPQLLQQHQGLLLLARPAPGCNQHQSSAAGTVALLDAFPSDGIGNVRG